MNVTCAPTGTVLGISIFVFGFLVLGFAYKFIDKPDNERQPWLALGIGIVGFAAIAQAIFLVLPPVGSTPTDCRSENVGVAPIVVPELKFGNVQRHVLGANFMEAADDTALEDRPEAFNRIGVNRADNILLPVMIDRLMIVFVRQTAIDAAFVSGEQANLVGNHFAHKSLRGLAGDVVQNARDDIALAADSANNGGLGRDPRPAGAFIQAAMSAIG